LVCISTAPLERAPSHSSARARCAGALRAQCADVTERSSVDNHLFLLWTARDRPGEHAHMHHSLFGANEVRFFLFSFVLYFPRALSLALPFLQAYLFSFLFQRAESAQRWARQLISLAIILPYVIFTVALSSPKAPAAQYIIAYVLKFSFWWRCCVCVCFGGGRGLVRKHSATHCRHHEMRIDMRTRTRTHTHTRTRTRTFTHTHAHIHTHTD